MGSNKLFPFSTVVFASWDYHLTDAAAARNLRHSIRNQLKEMVNDALLEDKIEDTRTRIKAYIWKVSSITFLYCHALQGTQVQKILAMPCLCSSPWHNHMSENIV